MLAPSVRGLALVVLIAGCRQGAGEHTGPGDGAVAGEGQGEPAGPPRTLPCELGGMPFADDGTLPVTGTATTLAGGIDRWALAPDGGVIVMHSGRLHEIRPPDTAQREIGTVSVPPHVVRGMAATATDVYVVDTERVDVNYYRVRRFPR